MRKIGYYEYNDPSNYKKMLDLKKMAVLNKSLYEGMGSLKKIPNDLDMLNFLPAQLYTFPLVSDELVNTNTSLGSRSKKGINLETPIMLTAMSLGSLPKEQKLALAKASTLAGTAANTGEGACST